MELGEKILKARQEAGLSQRQLCADVITRNMLSQIEHGTARPSMATLQYLASRLGKNVGYFLEDGTVSSPNQALLDRVRREVRPGKRLELLKGYQSPDEVFDFEFGYLHSVATLEAAREAAQQGKTRYARELLREPCIADPEIPGLERARLLLLGQLSEEGLEAICSELPDLDEELLLRARAALEQERWDRGLCLLDAMEDQSDAQLLRGKLLMGKGDYAGAIPHLRSAEAVDPEKTAPELERCFRELGDYKQAYFYACQQRENGGNRRP